MEKMAEDPLKEQWDDTCISIPEKKNCITVLGVMSLIGTL